MTPGSVQLGQLFPVFEHMQDMPLFHYGTSPIFCHGMTAKVYALIGILFIKLNQNRQLADECLRSQKEINLPCEIALSEVDQSGL